MVDKSIAYRLSFFVSIGVILVFIAFIILYFLFNQKLLRENIENKAIGLSSEVSSMINREVISVSEITANLADQVIYYNRHNNVEELLTRVIVKYPFLDAINVYFDTTYVQPYHYFTIIQNDGVVDFKKYERPLFLYNQEEENFRTANLLQSPGWTPAFFNPVNGEAIASYSHPLTAEKGGSQISSGYITSHMALKSVNDSINQIKIGLRGYAFVIDEQGNYLTHPDENKILNSNLLSASHKILNRENRHINNIFSERIKSSTIAYPELLNYEKSWVYFSPIPQSPWFLVFIMPYGELYSELYAVTIKMSLLALLGIVLIYFLVSYIIEKQIRPLSHITSRLSSFSSPFILNTKNEVKQVANSLEYLKVWFEQYQIARETEEKNNSQHDLDLQQASEIQQSLIKTGYPAFPNRSDIDVHVIYKPSRTVSGDLFDYFFIDDNNLIFTIGDVSGNGIPAAIFMSVCQTVIKKNAHLRHPKKIVEKTNYELCTSNHHQYFLTLFLGNLNVKTGILTYCNAAHTFPFILKENGEFTEVKSIHGLPLGLYPDKIYGAEQIRLGAGDAILLYTDGVYDALNEINISTGNQWIQKNLSMMKNRSPKEINELLNQELSGTNNGQQDDMCLFTLKYTP